jgi:hypothetical protein
MFIGFGRGPSRSEWAVSNTCRDIQGTFLDLREKFQYMLKHLWQSTPLEVHFFLNFCDKVWTKPMSLRSKRHLKQA